MNYVESLDLFGINAKEIPCIKGKGAPTEKTVAAVGCFYMDTDNGVVYKCTGVVGWLYEWSLISEKVTDEHILQVIEKYLKENPQECDLPENIVTAHPIREAPNTPLNDGVWNIAHNTIMCDDSFVYLCMPYHTPDNPNGTTPFVRIPLDTEIEKWITSIDNTYMRKPASYKGLVWVDKTFGVDDAYINGLISEAITSYDTDAAAYLDEAMVLLGEDGAE